jgi:hypothetical protein
MRIIPLDVNNYFVVRGLDDLLEASCVSGQPLCVHEITMWDFQKKCGISPFLCGNRSSCLSSQQMSQFHRNCIVPAKRAHQVQEFPTNLGCKHEEMRSAQGWPRQCLWFGRANVGTFRKELQQI